MQPPPIFVIGSARSGTTLLQAALGAHPRIAAPPETHFVFRIARLADFYGDLGDPQRLERAVRDAVDTPLLAPLGIDVDQVLSRARRTPTYAGLFDALMCTIAEAAGKERWSEKTPNQRVTVVWRLFPEARAVHLVRDPRDVMASRARSPLNFRGAATTARSWRDFNLNTIRAGAAAGPRRYLRIRYEDLVRDPEAVLRLVCAFVGEDFDPAMVSDRSGMALTASTSWQQRATGPIEPSSDSRAAGALPRRQRAAMAAIVRHHLPALGYQADPRLLVVLGLVLNAFGAVPSSPRRRRPPARSPEERYDEVQRAMARATRTLAADRGD